MPLLKIEPPLLNSANPWCTTIDDLRELFLCPFTGAVTTRTSLLKGFSQDPLHHGHVFFRPDTQHAKPEKDVSDDDARYSASLNTYGYSPLPLASYLEFIKQISSELDGDKPFIVSVTGTAEEVVECYRQINELQKDVRMPLAMEVNLSCPNISGKPPPAYNLASMSSYFSALGVEQLRHATRVLHANSNAGSEQLGQEEGVSLRDALAPISIKTPPYTYADQFATLVSALSQAQSHTGACPISYITATNTLGTSLLLAETLDSNAFTPACVSGDGVGIGGMAGTPLHPLALGNVYQLAKALKANLSTQHIQIIGVGGVSDAAGYRRMRSVGAVAVGVGTALGRQGVEIFESIATGLDGEW